MTADAHARSALLTRKLDTHKHTKRSFKRFTLERDAASAEKGESLSIFWL